MKKSEFMHVYDFAISLYPIIKLKKNSYEKKNNSCQFFVMIQVYPKKLYLLIKKTVKYEESIIFDKSKLTDSKKFLNHWLIVCGADQ